MEKKVSTPVQKGLIITLVLIVYGLALYFTDQFTNKGLSYVQYLILVGGIIWACIVYANQMDGNVTFGNVFAHGFKTTAFVAAAIAVYTLIATKFLFPDMIDKAMDAARQEMLSDGKMSEDQIDQGIEIGRKFFIPFAVGGIIFIFALLGALGSLIGAAAAKKQPKDPFAQPQI
ncbi:DUF4199 domain-containing protein [Panacibacter sp. DH6]|uniref:DUF4199 domain-containing protein n=1 Tax=Panacibacter microcysteis TaxID=2793269 RepID=A0A931MCZ0_9BACT|nr:DUF4199 domain-containing protein [Panacibacter microcysteis]MBG9378381.1 DUF4199 domain-containing protein [Panacibacter microcysteis]